MKNKMNKIIEVLKNPKENKELYQRITYALSNLSDYPDYYQETPIEDEESDERIKEIVEK
jgi:hypothetical protein